VGAGGREEAVGVPVRATYHGPAAWADPMVDPGHQPQGGPQTNNLEEERARRRVMVREGRLCAAAVAAPQGGKR
jgi:hypothetical protein